MKHITSFRVALFAVILLLTMFAHGAGTVIKELNSTFTGNEYGIASETYSDAT